VAAPAAGGAAAAAEEKTEFTVTLTAIGENKISQKTVTRHPFCMLPSRTRAQFLLIRVLREADRAEIHLSFCGVLIDVLFVH